jgi:hypothetical protein
MAIVDARMSFFICTPKQLELLLKMLDE